MKQFLLSIRINGKTKLICIFRIFTGVGNILSTLADIIAFDEALFNGKLIAKSSLASMKPLTAPGMGMGMVSVPFYSKIGYGHDGGTYSTYSLVANFNADSLTIAYSVNGQVYPFNDIAIGMLMINYNLKYELPVFQRFIVPDTILNRYIGDYTSADIPAKISITKNNNGLVGQVTGQSAFNLDAKTVTTFNYDALKVSISFNPDRSEMTLNQDGHSFLFKKLK